MRIIDAHIHYSGIQAFRDAAETAGVDYSHAGLISESRANGVVGHVVMGLSETTPGAFPDINAKTPMEGGLGIVTGGAIPFHVNNIVHRKCVGASAIFGSDIVNETRNRYRMKICLGINPHTLDMAALEGRMGPDVAGFKLYAGYYQTDINDPVYSPVYALAAKHGLTVAIHMGDTYSERGLLEYARPVHADRLAVKWRDVNFVLCHLGFPWVMEACEVAYKNRNVYLDMSGLIVGGADEFDRVMGQRLITDYFRQGLLFLDDYKKVLFGSDWPLAPMARYIELCRAITPEHSWEDVFHNNAAALYFRHP